MSNSPISELLCFSPYKPILICTFSFSIVCFYKPEAWHTQSLFLLNRRIAAFSSRGMLLRKMYPTTCFI
jgi:hypothetical protein